MQTLPADLTVEEALARGRATRQTVPTDESIERTFTYHKPFGDQSDRYQLIRSSARQFANQIKGWCPESRERSLALTNLQQAVMWANAAIAINESEPESERG